MKAPDLITAVREYCAVDDLHQTVVAEVIEHCGENDADQLRELLAALHFFALARELMDCAIARAEQTSTPAVQQATPGTSEPSRQPGQFPLHRV